MQVNKYGQGLETFARNQSAQFVSFGFKLITIKSFSKQVTKFVQRVLASLIFFISLYSFAVSASGWDYNIAGSTRSFPFGGSLDLELGHAFVLWGMHSPTVSPLSGFIRPELSVSMAGLYNSGQVALEVFPLGIFGVKASYELVNNEADYQDFDCKVHRCSGSWAKSSIEGQLALGAGPFFLTTQVSSQQLKPDDRDDRDLIEPSYSLPISSDGEKVHRLRAMLGVNWSESLQSLLVFHNHHFRDQDLSSQYQYLALRKKVGRFSGVMGAGIVRSALFAPHGSVFGGLRWDIEPSIKLF